MDPRDRDLIIERYRERVSRFGHGAAAIGEPKGRQPFYYHFMLQVDSFNSVDSVLDVGCGYGDLHGYLSRTGWNGHYTGIDINADLVKEGRRRRPGVDLRVLDIQEEDLGEVFDWCFSCHVITSATKSVTYLEHLDSMLHRMWAHCRKGILFNLLSPLADYVNPVHARPPFGEVIAIVSSLTNRFALRHDYMPYEFALCLYKENRIDRDLLIFEAHEGLFRRLHGR